MIALLSFDVEEWFHAVPGFSGDDWRGRQSTVEAELDAINDRLVESGRSATFFVLGEVARSHPAAIRRLAESGFEVASHGSGHRFLHELAPDEFRSGLRDSVARIEDATGTKVRGYRAPMWSLTAKAAWAIEVLLDEGIEYDSSFFPLDKRDPSGPFWLRSGAGTILEIPPAPVWWRGHRLAMCLGMTFRNLPWKLYRGLVRLLPRHFKYYHLYLHPWELTSARRDLSGLGWMQRYYFRAGRRRSWAKFREATDTFAYTSIADRIDDIRRAAGISVPFDRLEGLDLQRICRIG